VDDIRHCQDPVDPTRVVAEEDTTEGREGAHQVRLPSDRRLDAIDVGRRREHHSTARHDGQMEERIEQEYVRWYIPGGGISGI